MTTQEEMAYLAELLLQASRWERSEGEVLSGLELEVQDRIRRLSGINTEDSNGRVQSELQTPVTYQQHFASTRVRVRNPQTGRQEWHPREQCEQVYYQKNKWKWVLKQTAETPKEAV